MGTSEREEGNGEFVCRLGKRLDERKSFNFLSNEKRENSEIIIIMKKNNGIECVGDPCQTPPTIFPVLLHLL